MTYNRRMAIRAGGRMILMLGLVVNGALLPSQLAAALGMAVLVMGLHLLQSRSFWLQLNTRMLVYVLGIQLAFTVAGIIIGKVLVVQFGPLILPVWTGLALTFGGLGIARMVWSAEKATEFERILGEIATESTVETITFDDLIAEYDRRVGNV